jgi:glycine cleavage system H lipoate-binding protein
MAAVLGFLGKDFQLPEDRLYDGARQYWLKREGALAVVGVSGPGVALTAGLVDLDVFPDAGDELVVDQEIAFATTKKSMKYFLSPLAGRVVETNGEASAESVNAQPNETWLVKIQPAAGWESRLLGAEAYAKKLMGTEHATPEAAQAATAGKSSPTCKSIYGGIKEG